MQKPAPHHGSAAATCSLPLCGSGEEPEVEELSGLTKIQRFVSSDYSELEGTNFISGDAGVLYLIYLRANP